MNKEVMIVRKWNLLREVWPKHGDKIIILGVPNGRTLPVQLPITYNKSVGLIENITHWRFQDEE